MLGAKYGPLGVSTNNIAEVSALDAGLEWCAEKGAHKVMVEGDSDQIEPLFLGFVCSGEFRSLRDSSNGVGDDKHILRCSPFFSQTSEVRKLQRLDLYLEEASFPSHRIMVHHFGLGNVVKELEEEWASILGPFFNPVCFLLDVDVSDYEDELQVVAKQLRTKKENFMGNAWDVFCVGVSTSDLGQFRRMMNEDLGWLSENNIEKVASLGNRIATILRLM
ncbi:hypothetical protein SUGI_0915360 [Cryptomeria japonica]|nr:hypothetical protein SUGI_0915360 [Cryptomeria japonica]